MCLGEYVEMLKLFGITVITLNFTMIVFSLSAPFCSLLPSPVTESMEYARGVLPSLSVAATVTIEVLMPALSEMS